MLDRMLDLALQLELPVVALIREESPIQKFVGLSAACQTAHRAVPMAFAVELDDQCGLRSGVHFAIPYAWGSVPMYFARTSIKESGNSQKR